MLQAADEGDLGVVPVWAGEAIDLVTGLMPAADLVHVVAAEASTALGHAAPDPR